MARRLLELAAMSNHALHRRPVVDASQAHAEHVAPLSHPTTIADSEHSAPHDHQQLPGPSAGNAVNPLLAQANALQGQIAAEVAQAKLQTTMQALPIATRLARDTRDNGGDGNRHDFLVQLDAVEDPDVRHQVMQQFQQQTGKSIHDSVAGDDDFARRDLQAVDQLISPDRDVAEEERARMTPEQRKELDAKAAKWAAQLTSTGSKVDANSDENAARISAVLGPRSAVEIEALRHQVRANTDGKLTAYEAVDWHMKGAKEDLAVQQLSGDRVGNAAAAIAHADGDPDVLGETLRELTPDERATLRKNPMVSINPSLGASSRQGEIKALLAGDDKAADGARISNLLEDPKEGVRAPDWFTTDEQKKTMQQREPENVLAELESMSPAEIEAAAADRDGNAKSAPFWEDHRTLEQMAASRFADDPVSRERVKALLSGNRAEDRALRLEQGMKSGNEKEIEGALANPDLALANKKDLPLADAGRLIAAQLEQQQTDIAFLAHDMRDQRAMAAMTGKDPGKAVGRNVSQALAEHFEAEKHDVPVPDDFFDAARAQADPEKREKEQEKKSEDDRIGADELWTQGNLGMATKIHRADGDEKQIAALGDEIESRAELDKDRADARTKYHRDLLPVFDESYDDMDFYEKHIFNLDHDGVASERAPGVLVQDEKDEHEEAQSRGLFVEEMAHGGGTEQLADWEIDAQAKKVGADGKLAAGVSRADFDNATVMTQKQLMTEEQAKIDYGEKEAASWGTLMKVVGLCTANPLLVGLADAGGGLGEIAIKESIEGEAYHDGMSDLGHVGATVAGDGAAFGFGEVWKGANVAKAVELEKAEEHARQAENGLADAREVDDIRRGADDVREANALRREAAEAAEKTRATGNMIAAGAKTGVTTTLDDAIDHKSGNEYARDMAFGAAGVILPSFAGGLVESAFAHADEAQIAKTAGSAIERASDDRLGKAAGVAAEYATSVAVDPEHDAKGKLLEMAADKHADARIEHHNAGAPPNKQWSWSKDAYSWKAPEHEKKNTDGE
jgi:hypothetical protein